MIANVTHVDYFIAPCSTSANAFKLERISQSGRMRPLEESGRQNFQKFLSEPVFTKTGTINKNHIVRLTSMVLDLISCLMNLDELKRYKMLQQRLERKKRNKFCYSGLDLNESDIIRVFQEHFQGILQLSIKQLWNLAQQNKGVVQKAKVVGGILYPQRSSIFQWAKSKTCSDYLQKECHRLGIRFFSKRSYILLEAAIFSNLIVTIMEALAPEIQRIQEDYISFLKEIKKTALIYCNKIKNAPEASCRTRSSARYFFLNYRSKNL